MEFSCAAKGWGIRTLAKIDASNIKNLPTILPQFNQYIIYFENPLLRHKVLRPYKDKNGQARGPAPTNAKNKNGQQPFSNLNG